MIKLIASAAYVDQELAAEFGRLPPAFLPIGVSRLYEAQVPAMGGGPVFLTLPESFVPYAADTARLNELGVTLVTVPDGVSLAESVLYSLAIIAAPIEPVVLLHGDTLIEDVSQFLRNENCIAVQAEGDDYSWAAVTLDGDRVLALDNIQAGAERDDPLNVVCGLFSFSTTSALMNALARARGDFVRGLTLYAEDHDVRGIQVTRWHDFGHLQTYFRSRRMITTARAFNTLCIDEECVRKSSADRPKMQAEAHWLRSVPQNLQPYCARYLGADMEVDRGSYATEYLCAPTLSELYVFSNIGRPTWRRILASCSKFLTLCNETSSGSDSSKVLRCLVGDKTLKRLETYASSGGVSIDRQLVYDGAPLPSLLKIAEIVLEVVQDALVRPETVMHGDFCFSNVLYNSRNGRINVIDPRGHIEIGRPSVFGDTRYDLAKMAHSIVGRYDHILAGRYALEARDGQFSIAFADEELGEWLGDAFSAIVIDGVQATDQTVGAIMISLFLSMLPLHADRPDRQMAFIANALRLYGRYEGSKP